MSAVAGTTRDSGRGRILDVAATLFLQHGYEAASLRLIADTVGMRPASLYYHFASKDGLLTEVLRRGIEVMEDAFDAASSATARRSAPERLEAHVRAHLAALYENGPYTAVHVVAFRTASQTVRDAIVPLRDAYEARWQCLLTDLQNAGDLRPDVDLRVARLTLFGAMNASVEWFDPERGSLDDLARTITHQLWSGVKA